MKQEIWRAKLKYKTSVEEKVTNGSIQSAWRGMRAMAEIKHKELAEICSVNSMIENS